MQARARAASCGQGARGWAISLLAVAALVLADAAVSSGASALCARRVVRLGARTPMLLPLRGGEGGCAEGGDVLHGDVKAAEPATAGTAMALDAGSDVCSNVEDLDAALLPAAGRGLLRESGVPTAALRAGFASVVKVFAWTTEPHFSQPWQMKRQRQGTGTGFIIEGRRILTNAHNIANQNWVLVQRHGIPRKYPAQVMAVGHECDLAVLNVEDASFWEGTQELTFGDIPELQQSVVVVGFPTGGDNLCVTAGVVSRVDVHEYAHSGFSLLCVQIDAAVNAGNSGGPALGHDSSTVIGVTFQGREDAENVGYIIPSSVVRHFLDDIARHGTYRGFVTLGITWAPLENKHLRDYVGIDSCDVGELDRSGVMVCKVDKTRHTDDTLQRGDTLLAFDGVSVADDGTIRFRVMERLAFAHLVSQKFVGEECELTILRNREVQTKRVRLAAPKYLVPECVYDTPPRYFITGGLVFVPLTFNYMLHEFGKRYYEKAPNVLLAAIDERFQRSAGEEVVVLSQILASEISSGYDGIRNIILESFNGVPLLNLRHLHDLVEACTDEFMVFGLSHTQTVVLRREETINSTADILKQHGISSPKSAEFFES